MTFKMPMLSKYLFDIDDICYNNDKIQKVFKRVGRDDHYYLIDDKGNKCCIRQREIIQYGKHLTQTENLSILSEIGYNHNFIVIQHYIKYMSNSTKSFLK